MQIPEKAWNDYITRLSRLNQKAGQLMQQYIEQHGTQDVDDLIRYAYALVTKYGEGSAELACQMYDALAEAQGATVPRAEPARPASYGEVARMVHSTQQSPPQMQNGVSRLVKRAGADTTLQNAQRDGAQFAWVPHGDTCPFCVMLASNGWRKVSKAALKKGHAEHIHANCDCEYAVRFDSRTNVAGYDPDKYLRQYGAANGDLNAMRRERYAQNRDKINAQKRAAYKQAAYKEQRFLSESFVGMADEIVLKAIGAKSKNYDILDLSSGMHYHLVEGSKLQNKEVFCGKGSKKEYRKAYVYANRYGGKIEDWQHVKAFGVVSTDEGDRPAEIHWSQCEGIGKVDLFIKRWLDEG